MQFGKSVFSVGLLVACFSIATNAWGATNKDFYASVELVEGSGARLIPYNVTASDTVTSRPLKVSDIVHEGDTIVTDANSTVVIRFGASRIQILASTRFRLEDQNPSVTQRVFYLIEGFIHSLIHNDGSGEIKVKINTPSGTLGVRGTQFVMTYDRSTNETKVHMIEGTVATGRAGAADADLTGTVQGGFEAPVSPSASPANPQTPDQIRTQFTPQLFMDLPKEEPENADIINQHIQQLKAAIAGGQTSIASGLFSSLLSMGVDPRLLNIRISGKTLVHAAYVAGMGSLAKTMVQNGVDPNVTDENGNTLAHDAAIAQDYNGIKYAVKYARIKGNMDIQNNNGMTPVMLAAKHGCHDCIDKMVSYATLIPNYNLQNHKDGGKTAMDYATIESDFLTANSLLDAGVTTTITVSPMTMDGGRFIASPIVSPTDACVSPIGGGGDGDGDGDGDGCD